MLSRSTSLSPSNSRSFRYNACMVCVQHSPQHYGHLLPSRPLHCPTLCFRGIEPSCSKFSNTQSSVCRRTAQPPPTSFIGCARAPTLKNTLLHVFKCPGIRHPSSACTAACGRPTGGGLAAPQNGDLAAITRNSEYTEPSSMTRGRSHTCSGVFFLASSSRLRSSTILSTVV